MVIKNSLSPTFGVFREFIDQGQRTALLFSFDCLGTCLPFLKIAVSPPLRSGEIGPYA